MNKSIFVVLAMSLLGGCATKIDTRLSLPYSERVDIIHSYEASNFIPVDKGEKDIMLFFKSTTPETLGEYRTFDTHAINQNNVVYQSINRRRAASKMRKYLKRKLRQYKLKHVGKSLSQAGIAVTISSYQKILGKNVEELLMVVFDRKKAWQISRENKEVKGFELLKQTAIWVGVVRKVPEKQMDISQGVHYMSRESFKQMVDMMFEVFMKDSNYIPLD
ncbi:MAG: hypothetical protein OEY52_13340 [Gammaproteobacteria bacterium]|nr:hypothetical protein [Gammaproteobacteria bacterium]